MIDSILRGNVTINWDMVTNDESNDIPPFSRRIGEYILNERRGNEQPDELISDLAFHFKKGRVFGSITGQVYDADKDKNS